MNEFAAVARQVAEETLNQAIDQGGNQDAISDAQQTLAEGDAAREDGLSGDLTKFKESVNKYKDTLAKAESTL